LLCLHGLGSCSCRSVLSFRSRVTAAWGASVSMDTSASEADAMITRDLTLQDLTNEPARECKIAR
jgi:hypothetical protein